jgi:hypothetical protein
MKPLVAGMLLGFALGVAFSLLLRAPEADRQPGTGTPPTPRESAPPVPHGDPALPAASPSRGENRDERHGSGPPDSIAALLNVPLHDSREWFWFWKSVDRVDRGKVTREGLARLLSSPERLHRMAAMRLATKANPPALDLVIRTACDDAASSVRIGAVRALGRLAADHPDAIEALLAHTRSRERELRAAAFEGLLPLAAKDERVRQALVSALSDHDPRVRKMATSRIADLGTAGEEYAARAILAGRYDEDLLDDLARAAVRHGAAREILRRDATPRVVTALAKALLDDVDGDPELIRGNEDLLPRLLAGFEPKDRDALTVFFDGALTADQREFVAGVARSSDQPTAARSGALTAVIGFTRDTGLAAWGLDLVREVLTDPTSPTELELDIVEALTFWCDAVPPFRDRARKLLADTAAGDANEWVRGAAKEALGEFE